MDELHALVDEQVRKAIEAGLFDNLPGAGRPLEIEDTSAIPQELRASYILLKSAGVLPDELALRQELLRLEDLVAACQHDGDRDRLRAQRSSGALRLALMLERRGFGAAHQEYAQALARKLARD